MLYTIEQQRDHYIPKYKRGINGNWHIFTDGSTYLWFATFDGAYSFLRRKCNYNEALLVTSFIRSC